MRTGLNEAALRRLYTDLGKTDKEIAYFFGCDRTAVVHMRKRYGITTRKSVGEIGEEMVMKELRSRGYIVEDMNEKDKLSPFDILLDSSVRIEVKTSTLLQNDKYFYFALSEKESNDNVVSETRLKLPSKRTRKRFEVTCDILVLVGLENRDCHFFMVDPRKLSSQLCGIKIPLDPYSDSKWNKYREQWGVFEEIKKLDCANNRTQNKF